MPLGGKDIAMTILSTNYHTFNRAELAFVNAQPATSRSRTPRLPSSPTQHRTFIRSKRNAPEPRNGVAQFLAEIDGVPVLVRFLVADAATAIDSNLVSKLEKIIDRMEGSSLRHSDLPKQALASVESIPSAEHPAQIRAPSNDTVLRVGALELDLLDRTAMRGDRRIDLRPREFQLLKYMMERSDKLLSRAALLKDVWNYKFVPKTNLVDVHLGRLRRKVDGPNEPALIRNVRGVGFVLGATSFSQCSASDPSEQPGPSGRKEHRNGDSGECSSHSPR
jgi:DNA-binding winged helix-turn-helix (wHTH) protein